MAFLNVIRPGMLTTVQDCGRWGFQALGVPVCGAMDTCSHRLANGLVGNEAEAATLEVTLTGPRIEFDAPTVFAVTGAEFHMTLDEAPIRMNQPALARPGSVLRFGERTRGSRAYIAVAGGVLVPPVFNSRSTHVPSGMGGYEGRALRAGDCIPIAEVGVREKGVGGQPLDLPEGGARVRVLPGAHVDRLGRDVLGRLASQRYRISPRSNRMGYRLEGAPVAGSPPAELISSPVPTGSLQVPPTGQPILLMADHATTGGYAVAATVISADLPVAGQLAPGDWIEFAPCSLEVADAARRALEQALGRSVV
jgi:antagonist of KipI